MVRSIAWVRLQEQHLPLIRQWRNENRTAFLDETEVTEERHLEWWHQHEHQQRVGREDFWLIEGKDDGLVGQASLYDINADKSCQFGRMIVLPQFRRLGYGTQIVSEACQWAQRMHGAKKVELVVRVDNLPAYRLYKSCGFVVTDGTDARVHKMVRVLR